MLVFIEERDVLTERLKDVVAEQSYLRDNIHVWESESLVPEEVLNFFIAVFAHVLQEE